MKKYTLISFFFIFFVFSRADNQQKRLELLSHCGKDLKRGQYFGEFTDLDDFPWLALLQYRTIQGELKYLCGGVLISDQYVLTAAHCVNSPSNKLQKVILGEYNTRTNPDCTDDGDGTLFCAGNVTQLGVSEAIVHENYSPFNSELSDGPSDLALLKLSSKVQFTRFIQPICLPYFPESATGYLVAGWGKSMAPGGSGFTVKSVAKVATIPPQECSQYPVTPGYSSEDHICAGARERVCVGDAGGPLMNFEVKNRRTVRMTVFGIGFMDLTCQFKGIPGVYTKVHKYVPWIESHIFN